MINPLILIINIRSNRRMTVFHEYLLDWLHDAHALERKIEALLKGQAIQLGRYPDLK